MDVEAVSAALVPEALAPPIAKSLNLPQEAVATALTLLAEGAQPAFLVRYRPEKVGNLRIMDLERIQAAAARAAAFEFKRQGLLDEIRRKRSASSDLETHILQADHPLDLEDVRVFLRRKKRGPAAKARSAGLAPLAERVWLEAAKVEPWGLHSQGSGEGARGARAGNDEPSEAEGETESHEHEEESEESPDEESSSSEDDAPAPAAAPAPSLEGPFELQAAAQAWTREGFSDPAAVSTGVQTLLADALSTFGPLRRRLRKLLYDRGRLRSRVVEEKKEKAGRYAKHFDRNEPCKALASNTVLSIHRGEREGVLRVDIEIDLEQVLDAIVGALKVDLERPEGTLLREAAKEAWEHGLGKAVKSGTRKLIKERADRDAIAEFCEALRPLLLAPALGPKPVLAIDPGHQHGCRLVALGSSGEILAEDTVYPLAPKLQAPQAKARIAELCLAHGVELIAVGNSGGGREVERLCREMIRESAAAGEAAESGAAREAAAPTDADAKAKTENPESESAAGEAPEAEPREGEAGASESTPVEEGGEGGEAAAPEAAAAPETRTIVPPGLGSVAVASVDSDPAALFASSRVAKESMKKSDAATRRAVALGRRVQDPLVELAKVDPRKLGLGQNQREVDQEELRAALEQVIASCVSEVTVDVNRVDADTLARVAGLSQASAKAILGLRESKGRIRSRAELLEVPGFAGKAFEQSAGFLRVYDGDQPLDATMIHPEHYGIVTEIAHDLGVTVSDMLGDDELVGKIEIGKYVDKRGVSGAPVGRTSLERIASELREPGVDPRPPFDTADFSTQIDSFGELEVGMELEGIVTHLANFGAFVDVGLSQEGLVHVSELSHEFVTNPLDAVHVGQRVRGRVIEISPERKRFSLSLKALMPKPERPQKGGGAGKRKRGEGPKGKGRGKGPPGKGKGKGGRPREERVLGFRMDLSDLAKQLEEG